MVQVQQVQQPIQMNYIGSTGINQQQSGINQQQQQPYYGNYIVAQPVAQPVI